MVGTGYVGLVSGACLAAKGHSVVCVDVDEDKVDRINQAIPPIHERGLDELLQKTVGRSLEATTDLTRAVVDTELSLIAVGTPFDGVNIDLTQIREAARQIGEAMALKESYHGVVVKSTVVPGTTDEVVRPILEQSSGRKAARDFGLGMNPEFLREGEAIEDFMKPDRLVLGGIDERTIDHLGELYRPFPNVDVLRTNNRTAEMIKYTSNSLLATMISFSNEIANLCSEIEGVDAAEVMRGVHLDKRLSPILDDGTRINPAFTTYLEAGCGFGGSCFPKDVNALIAHGQKRGNPMRLLEAAMSINRDQPARMIALLKKHFETLEGAKVAVLGLAFKPGTDDMRESPAIPITETLIARGAEVSAYDPAAKEEARKVLGEAGIRYFDRIEDALEDVDAVLLLTRWDEFRRLPDLLSDRKPQPLVIDGRRMLNPTALARYEGIGR